MMKMSCKVFEDHTKCECWPNGRCEKKVKGEIRRKIRRKKAMFVKAKTKNSMNEYVMIPKYGY